MFDSHAAALGGTRGRLASGLLVLPPPEGATIPFMGHLLGPHLFIGLMLIPPVALKLGSVGWRFVRYYTHDEPYVRKGPPPTLLRGLAPGVVITTVALFGTGVARLVAGPPSQTLIFAHKLSFFAWVGLMALHVLGHLLELPALASADWRRGQRVGGAAGRAGGPPRRAR